MDQRSNAPPNQNNILSSEKENRNGSLTFTVLPYDSELCTLNADDQDYFSAILPQEMILCIFKFLSMRDLRTCATVSKYWLMLSSSAVLYKDVALYSISIKVSLLERILNCSVQAINLKFTKIIHPTPAVQPFFKTRRFNSLQRIAICNLTDKPGCIEELLAASPNLKVMKLQCHGSLGINFFRHVVKLQFLENLHFQNLTINDIPKIVKVFKKANRFMELKTLSFYSVQVRNAHISAEPREFLNLLLGLCPNLEVLYLPQQDINQAAFELILQMKYLKKLDICEIFLDTNFMLPLTENCEKCTNLRKLHIAHIHVDMPERMNRKLLKLSPNLEYLRIGGVITLSIFKQILRLKKLKHLLISDADLTILNNFQSYKRFDELQHLSLLRDENCETHFLSNLLQLICHEKLRELTLAGFDFNEDILRYILEMKNLEKLCLMKNKILQVFKAGRNLTNYRLEKIKHLNLMDGLDTNPILVEIILLSCQNTTFLEMFLFSVTEGIWSFRNILSMKDLEELYLFHMDSDNISYIPGSIDNSRRFSKLKKLRIDYAKCENQPRRLEDLLPLCCNVHHLHLTSILLTDYICKSIASMKELNSLILDYVCGISNAKIDIILNGCLKLTRKNIQILKPEH